MAQAKMAILLKPWLGGSPPSLHSTPPGRMAKTAYPYPWGRRQRRFYSGPAARAVEGGSFQAKYAEAFPGSVKVKKIRPPDYDLRTDEPWKKYLDTKLNNNMTIAEFIARFAQGKSGLRTYRHQRAKLPLPEARGRPLLQWQGLENRKPETQRIEQLLRETEDKFVMVLGAPGCGKTRCMFELLSNEYGFYYTAESEVNRGSGDTVYCQRMMQVLMDDVYDVPKRDVIAEQHARALLLGRMLVLDYIFRLRVPGFNPYIFLQLQVEGPRMTGMDIFRELTAVLCGEYENDDMTRQIDKVWAHLQYGVPKLRVVLEEAHVLFHCRPNVFPLRKSHLVPISIYYPMVKAMLFPSETLKGHELVICGSGLEMLEDKTSLLGPLKQTPTVKFADFSVWENEMQLKAYLDTFMQVTVEECRALLWTWSGRMRPLVNCVEGLLGGLDPNSKPTTYKSVENCIRDYETHALEKIDARHTHAYVLKEMRVIDRTTYDLVRNVYRAFAWWGDTFQAITVKEMKMVYLGFARMQTIPVDDPATGECLAAPGVMVSAQIDEPLIVKVLHKHFSADAELLQELRVSSLVQGKGRLWEMHLFDDLVKLFDGATPLHQHALFKGVELPEIFQQPASIVNAEKATGPWVQAGSINAGLLEFMSQPDESRAPLLICEGMAGPDAFFFVRFRDGRTIGSGVYVKYKHRTRSYAGAMHCTDPEAAYTAWRGDPPRKDAGIQQAKRQAFEEFVRSSSSVPWSAGYIRLMLTYPAAESSGENTRVVYPARGGPQLVVEVSEKNAAEIFGEDHRKVLDMTKPVRLLDVRPEPVREDF
ncbi:uncharacterized protein LOC9653201 [Selaginella moellendorffii]|uniref:uncharacterized protein LOC9653201 n=1 Tax=Selaginella moellendorffii TaxID=88036 RepID=UPI000D1C94FB|nr:uncharacterized protein LOC9653201 [Selaginella moellendorffii]|eukprot:XP_024538903.1 uncharacterized protein LOC9653201 [Selaginella moellendorffii]